jgi:hypothetical protein
MAGGRPTKRTPEAEALIVEAVSDGLPYRLAAEAGGISYETLNEWRKGFSEFSDSLKKAESKAAQAAVKHITANDAWQARAWFLERRFPEEFGLPQAIERALIKLGFTPPGSIDSSSERGTLGEDTETTDPGE